MTINVSEHEVAELIRAKYDLPADAKVVITTDDNSDVGRLKRAIDEALTKFPGAGNKIAAIKHLREIGSTKYNLSLGLAEAKMAIETPDVAINNMKTKGSI